MLFRSAESGSAVSIHGPLYSAASGVEADGCGQVAGVTALYRLCLEIRFWCRDRSRRFRAGRSSAEGNAVFCLAATGWEPGGMDAVSSGF